MNHSEHQSISTKFSKSLNFRILWILLFFTLLIVAYKLYDYRLSSQSRLSEIAALAKTSLPYSMWNLDNFAMDEVVKALTLGKDVIYVALIMEGEQIKEVNNSKSSKTQYSDFQNSIFYLTASEIISYEESNIGEVQIVLSQSGLFKDFALNIAVLLILTFVLLWLISSQSVEISKKFVFQPLGLLEEKAISIASGKLDTDLDIDTNDEIGSLSQSLDKMRLSIIKLFDDLKAVNKELEQYNQTLEDKVQERTLALQENNKKLDLSLKKQEILNKNIIDSIQYAKLIQTSILPSKESINRLLPESYFYWQPKDIVGGDIYFFEPYGDKALLGIVDCTGHGVPGAFMTMVVATSIKTILNSGKQISPAYILAQLNILVKRALRQDQLDSHSDDGLDAAFCMIDSNQKKLIFSGARTSLFYKDQEDKIAETKGDKMSLAYKKSDEHYVFSEHTFNTEIYKHYYLTTDGLLDQKGGKKGLPFGKKRMLNNLSKNIHQEIIKQGESLINVFDHYAIDYEHQDDISFCCFKIE